jgi:predicted helicase
MSQPGRPARRKNSLPKLIEKYYADLADLAKQNVLFEMGLRQPFHSLLAAAGKEHGWTLIAEQEKKVGGKTIRPDGTFKDEMNLVRGYWEAKDTSDKLDTEIKKKQTAGYPLNNIIFEDTQTAVLYQHGQRILTADMRDPAKLAELITEFFRYVEPEIEEFEQAVEEFKERVPDLAEGLAKKIADAHRTNPAFKKAFADFFELCQTSLNPNISQAAVDEMLIQHILTERLIREIFDNPEFVRRNVIAAEVEKVMQAMTSHSFDRTTYLRDLDRFYVAIEHAARTMTDWSDKQYFLNTVYERFFQGYSVKLADTMGIVYTPQEIVDFMCASVAEVLEREFGKKLWSDDVYIIDPCTGTGNFIVNLIRRIPKAKLEDVYKHRLFANEIMLLPYYIAALNIEHAFFEQAGRYESFEGLCFVDTLDLAEHAQGELGFMTEKNSERVARQRNAPITVVVGNPPYNASQEDENDRNRNRLYPVVDGRIAETYVKDSEATLRMQLYDPYVRFFRWASDRLEGRDGIVCFVTNNSFVQKVAFGGMRKHLVQDFSTIYHLDLHGDVRQNPKISGTANNVFGIQTGVGITLAVRRGKRSAVHVNYHRVPELARREIKCQMLVDARAVGGIGWQAMSPTQRNDWIVPKHADEFDKFIPVGSKAAKSATDEEDSQAIFRLYSSGVKTNSDVYVFDFSRDGLEERGRSMVEAFNSELDRWKRAGRPENIDAFLKVDERVLKWIRNTKRTLSRGEYLTFFESTLRSGMYRPYCKKVYLFERAFSEDIYRMPSVFPTSASESENSVICCTIEPQIDFSAYVVNCIPCLHVGGRQGQVLPFYVYDAAGTNRRENITDWALKQFRDQYKDKKIDKWAIFYYVYGLLHHPGYRQKYADNLKRELPRIPFAADFRAFATAGEQLAKLHLDYEKLKPYELEFIETPGVPLSYRIEDKTRLSKDKLRLTVNPSLILSGIPPEAFEYRLGNRSALEWVIDQYQVSTDKRSGITSDPNRDDDPQYIVRLVGQVIRVSIETVGIVKGLPAKFEPK